MKKNDIFLSYREEMLSKTEIFLQKSKTDLKFAGFNGISEVRSYKFKVNKDGRQQQYTTLESARAE